MSGREEEEEEEGGEGERGCQLAAMPKIHSNRKRAHLALDLMQVDDELNVGQPGSREILDGGGELAPHLVSLTKETRLTCLHSFPTSST